MSESTHEPTLDQDTPIAPEGQGPIADIEALASKMSDARAAVGQSIFGQELVVEESMITLLAGGHILLIEKSRSCFAILEEWYNCVLSTEGFNDYADGHQRVWM